MAYTTIDDPTIYFNTVLYTGNASTQSITGVNFSPSFVWIKSRNDTNSHYLFDVIRGVHEPLIADATTAEVADTNTVTSFDSDGFSIGNNTGINGSSDTEVAWNWKAGTSFTNDASSTGVGTIDSTGSINTTAGFSIISYTGTGSNATVGHGLDAEAKCIIFKDRDTASDWRMYHVGVGNTGALTLNNTNATQTNSVFFQDTTPTSTVFSLGTGTDVNNTNSFIAYCFAEKKGFSKFGSYTGNGNADGTFIYTGFKPAFILQKRTDSTSNWHIFDNKRETFNPQQRYLLPNTYDVEGNAGSWDFLSNGFKIRSSEAWQNNSGGTFIYMAFAESPFTNSNGVPNNAR